MLKNGLGQGAQDITCFYKTQVLCTKWLKLLWHLGLSSSFLHFYALTEFCVVDRKRAWKSFCLKQNKDIK